MKSINERKSLMSMKMTQAENDWREENEAEMLAEMANDVKLRNENNVS